ncbi:hypothetical protein [Nocardioides mesophilus]|uniref:Lipoprotein n=1 Tax=Nocardioides mesophilus TaxID=433659 RepID=A0A7G9RES8_9ACTN|nr:hypothetical protein [Nocardioides mesophilus]QNN54103.1 hypothetical protein H9L09_06935 [Nocardioides mesophilus]
MMALVIAGRTPVALALLLILAGCTAPPTPQSDRDNAATASPSRTETMEEKSAQHAVEGRQWSAGEGRQGGAAGSTELPPPPTARRTARAQQRRHQAACNKMRDQVDVTYRLLREPGPAGQRIWLELTIVNRSDHALWGETAGEVILTHPVHSRMPSSIEWGGSSADTAGARPRSSSTSPIYTIVGTKVDVHTDSRVRLIGVYTYLAAGHLECALPARMLAPAGLVLHHPRGRWSLDAATGDRLRVRGLTRMLDAR